MATVYNISESDSGSSAAQKINESVNNINAAIGSGGGGGGSQQATGIIALNEDAVQRISAAQQHFDLRKNNVGTYTTNTAANCFILAHISDLHNDVARYGRFRDFIDGVSSINAAIVSGDLTDGGKTAEFETMMGVTFSRIQPMQVIGNHERWDGKTIAQIGEALGQPKVSNAYTGYYYVDYTTPKIRIIVLNEYDTSSTTNSTQRKDGHWSQSQIDWFVGALDGAISNGYSVIVAMHCVEQGSGTGSGSSLPAPNTEGFYQRNMQWDGFNSTTMPHYLIEGIIDAFRNGTTVSGTYAHSDGTTSISLNHTFSGEGKFVAYVVGHAHVDMIGYSTEHPDQLYLMAPVGCVWGGKSGTSSNHRFVGGEISDLPRIEGTKSEDCFNVYGIDTINKRVKVIRVGSDMNDLMEPREVACFEYEPTISNS